MSDRPPHRLPASDVQSGWPQQRTYPPDASSNRVRCEHCRNLEDVIRCNHCGYNADATEAERFIPSGCAECPTCHTIVHERRLADAIPKSAAANRPVPCEGGIVYSDDGDVDVCSVCNRDMSLHAIPNSAADPYLDTSTTSKARNATHRRLRADVDATRNLAAETRREEMRHIGGRAGAWVAAQGVDPNPGATRNRVWDYPTIYAAILNSINRSGYRIDGPNQDSDVNASDLADCIVTELLDASGDDVCDKPHAGDPDPCDCGYPGDPHATRNRVYVWEWREMDGTVTAVRETDTLKPPDGAGWFLRRA